VEATPGLSKGSFRPLASCSSTGPQTQDEFVARKYVAPCQPADCVLDWPSPEGVLVFGLIRRKMTISSDCLWST